MAVYLVGYVFFVFHTRGFTKDVFIGEHLWTRLYTKAIEKESYAELKEGFDAAKKWDLCKYPERYEYWPDATGAHAFKNYSCIDLCGINSMYPTCITRFELVAAKSEQSVVFLTALDWAPINNHPPKHYFVAYDLSLFPIWIAYGSRTESESFFSREELVDEIHSCGKNMLTVILDYEGNEKKVIEPTNFIKLNLKEILTWGGAPANLETPFKGANVNYKPNAEIPKVIPRISGFNVKANLDCYSDPPTHREWMSTGPVCYLGFEVFSGPWVGESYISAVNTDGAVRPKRYHGIRIFFSRGGVYKYPFIGAVWSCIIEGIVLSQIPRLIVLFLASYCMSHLSNIHYRVINRSFNIMQECKGVAARLMTYTLDFHSLSNHRNQISKSAVAERMEAACREQREIQTSELLGLVNFCFNSMLQNHQDLPHFFIRLWRDLMQACGCNKQRKRLAQVELGEIKNFVRSCFRKYHLALLPEEHIRHVFKVMDVDKARSLDKHQCVAMVDLLFRMLFVHLRDFYALSPHEREEADWLTVDLQEYKVTGTFTIPQEWIVVSGAGNRNANGLYLRTTSMRNDREVYLKHSDSAYRIEWSQHSEAWMLDVVQGENRNTLYYCQENSITVPRRGKWDKLTGVPPEPTLRFEDFSSSYAEDSKRMASIVEANEHLKVCEKMFHHFDKDGSGRLPWNRGINRSQFLHCCCTDEVIEFKDLVQQFNVDRKLPILERCFDTSNVKAVHAMVGEDFVKHPELKDAISGRTHRVSGVLLETKGAVLSHHEKGKKEDGLHQRLFDLEDFAIRELGFKCDDPDEDEPEEPTDIQIQMVPTVVVPKQPAGANQQKATKSSWSLQAPKALRFRKVDGFIPRGDDIAIVEELTLPEAKTKCQTLEKCKGFCFAGDAHALIKVHFKSKADVVPSKPGEKKWTSYLVIQDEEPQSSSCCGLVKRKKGGANETVQGLGTQSISTQVAVASQPGAGVGDLEEESPPQPVTADAEKERMPLTPKTPWTPQDETAEEQKGKVKIPETGVFSGLEF